MAPAQSRLLIWSLPTLVLLFGFFWYKRKKSFFQTDPGGKDNISIKPSSHYNKGATNSSNNYDDEDDDEYTVHDLQFTSRESVSQVDNSYLQSEEVLPSDSQLFTNFLYQTSTPIDEKKNKELSDIVEEFTSSKNCETLATNICLFDSLDLELVNTEKAVENIPEKSNTEEENDTMVKKRKQISSESSIAESNSSNCPYEQSTDVLENKENENFNGATKEAEGFNKTYLILSKNEELSSVNSQCSNTSCLENKLSNLGLNTAQSIEKSERDSANHSPAEVMLGNPSICHFSDEHSEGSSDSGKGCSDVVTPPSRTPAGGSSVAGDQILSIYEFVLEQHIVGRLIGRHGSYLQDIRAKTNTNLFIKRHPETNKLKICAIEGSQQDIEAALAMIRQKFPLRRFPNLTLEKVTFVQPSSHCPLKPEIFQLQLVNGVNNDVLLSSLITAGHFFLQQPTHPSYPDLQKLNVMMNALYSSPEAPPLSEPIVDAICVAPTMGGWYRAQIMSIDEQNATSDVRFLDYGGYLTINNSLLRQIRGDFLLLPFQAIECILANVAPAGGEGAEWSEEARQVVQYHTQQQILQAQVYQYTETGIPLVYLYSTQATQNGLEVVLINQQLVARGYAEMVVASPDDDVQ